jgi:hypothetical protein
VILCNPQSGYDDEDVRIEALGASLANSSASIIPCATHLLQPFLQLLDSLLLSILLLLLLLLLLPNHSLAREDHNVAELGRRVEGEDGQHEHEEGVSNWGSQFYVSEGTFRGTPNYLKPRRTKFNI